MSARRGDGGGRGGDTVAVQEGDGGGRCRSPRGMPPSPMSFQRTKHEGALSLPLLFI